MPNISVHKPILETIDTLYCYDPGGTTGHARVHIDKQQKLVTVTDLGEFQTWSKLEDHFNELDKERTAVIYEGFRLRTIAANLIPVEVIGVIREKCLAKQIFHYEQLPGERYAVEKWYPQTLKVTSHHGSAMRHGIFFAIKHIAKGVIWELHLDYPKLMNEFLVG